MRAVVRNSCFLILISCCHVALSQEKFITLSGRITDAQTHQRIPFVNLQVKSRGIGTAANSEGEYIFKIAEKMMQDTLVFSCIGYKTLEMPLGLISQKNSIVLESAATELEELTINVPDGLDILKKVVAAIPSNYDTSTFQLTAFYRENLWLGDFELSFNESVLEIHKVFKTEKKSILNDQIRIIKGRRKQLDFSNDPQLYYWISGISNGARGSLGDDLVKYHNHDYSAFNPRNYKYYTHEYAGMIREGNRNLIILEVMPKENSRKAVTHMRLYIDEESYVIVKCDYVASKAGVRRVSRKDKGLAYAIMSKVVHATADYHKFEGSVTYKRLNGKWYLGSVTRHWEILLNSKKRNMVDELWHADMDLIITDIDTENASPIIEGNIGENKSSMSHLIGSDYDPAFWENYNILKPVLQDSIKKSSITRPKLDSGMHDTTANKKYIFTRGDTLRGKLSPLRTCYDVTFYHLDARVNMKDRSIHGNNIIRFKVVQPFRKMQVDLYENMSIDKIVHNDRELDYSREYNAVFVDFGEELQAGIESEIKIYYGGIPKTPDWTVPMNGGVLWDKDSLGNPWVQMVCQGSGASLWWPNKDHQSDKPDSMKIWITVPSEFTEVSNGRLIRKTKMPYDQTRYEWNVSYPINNYNVTFNIGKYVHLQDSYVSDDTLTIDYYVMPYNLEHAKKMFGQVKPMLECFEKNFGKYPFKRDGFALVESIYPMEHQSGVCIGKITSQSASDTNPLMWHESAHEWWGNSVTSKDVADMWIHEAFATYSEIMVFEHRFGKAAGYEAILDQGESVINEQPVIGHYDVNHIFYDIGDMYSKGSLMLHTFRNVLNNDTLWINLLHDIQGHFRHQTLTSDQLVSYVNQRTGSDYTYFFDQYLKFTTLPLLEVELLEIDHELVVRYRWEADVSNFRMPVKATMSPGKWDFIYPESNWKTITIKNLRAHEFDVDQDEFYIDVSID